LITVLPKSMLEIAQNVPQDINTIQTALLLA
jgi:hypothetical protein